MKAEIHTVTLRQFIRAIMKRVRHERKMHPSALRGRRHCMPQTELADITGHCFPYICAWETNQPYQPSRSSQIPPPTLHQALNCLEGVRL